MLIFAKYPEPGAVKTRMVPPLSPDEAAALHRASLLTICERVHWLNQYEIIVVGTPDERVIDLSRLVADTVTECRPQGDGDLGQRLASATDRALGDGADGVILLGADSPTLPARVLADAATNLIRHDAVLGPTDDGGYYLLGLRQPQPALFERIDWGGAHVADQTRERATAAGLDLHELPSWYDLDRFDDLIRAAPDLARLADDERLPTVRALRDLVTRLIERYHDGGTHAAQR